MQARYLPNLITALRVLLVAPILWCVLREYYAAAALLFLVAGLSDALDGWLAKRFDWGSWLGGVLDPLADKLLLVGMFLVLGWQGDLPVWLVALVIARDLIIVIGAIAYYFIVAPFTAAPLLISKLNTLVQLLLILAVVASKSLIVLPTGVISALIALTTVTVAISGGAYVWGWSQRALDQRKSKNV
ncbi:MAG: CDP-alcohol phosphatidyltransferase family protein [Gammaproteobacteria bacterium]